MKKILLLGVALSLLASCGKQQTEEEKRAEVERQVQERLASERQAEEQKKLVEREAELIARENALAEKENTAPPTATPEMRATQIQREVDESTATSEEGSESYDMFYTRLEPHGAWRQTSDYGYVWQPNVAERSRSWRPYTNGRWVYTDAGWTWYSEEPFGWATYHYGRWMRLRNVGWVWVPGNEWAPAWVSWRKSDDYVGWAPLPPEARFDRRTGIRNWADNYYDIGPEQYCFVATNEFGDRRMERTVVPVERNVTIVDQTINVTNITYSNTIIVNQGPDYDDLRRRTRQPIQRLRLERQTALRAENPRSVVRGEVIEMPAPVIAPARRSGRPRAIKETISQPVVDRGWTGVGDQQATEKARAKMKAEATPPPDAPARTFAKPASEEAPPAATPAASAPQTPAKPTAPAAEQKKGRRERLGAERKKKDAAAKDTQEKAAQKKAEEERQRAELGKGKAKQSKSASPTPSATPRVTPPAITRPAPPKPTVVPSPTGAKRSPVSEKKLRAATPPAATPPAATPPTVTASPSPKSAASPGPDSDRDRKEGKGKKGNKQRNKRDREAADASPSPSPRQR
jgi:hypothetical protein